MNKSFWLNFFLILAGVVAGSVVAEITAGVPVLSWLSHSFRFGTTAPFSIDLKIIQFSFGITLDISISVIIFIAVSLILGKSLIRK